jgi:hypothetical protein
MRYGQQPNRKQTFQDDRKYMYAVNESTNDIFLIGQDKSLVPLENPYLILLSQQMGFSATPKPKYFNVANQKESKNFVGDEQYANAFGDGAKKIGKQVVNGVKDFVDNPKQAIKNLGRELKIAKTKNKERVKSALDDALDVASKLAKGIKEVRPLKKAVFVVPRQSFLALVAVNYKGIATRYFARSDEDRKAIIDGWEEKWGGDRGTLENALNSGKDKLPLIISKRKRQEVIRLQDQLEANNYSNVAGVDDAAAIASLIATSLGIVSWVMGTFQQRKARKDAEQLEKDIADAEKNAENNDPPTTPINYDSVEIERQIQAIQSNTNLDQEQKDVLINELRGTLPTQTWWDKNKLWVIISSGGVVLLGTLAYLLHKRNQQQ